MSSNDVVDELRADKQHGASWLARRAAEGLLDATHGGDDPAECLAQVHTLARELAHARPSMAAIASTVAYIWGAGANAGVASEVRLAAIRSAAGDVRRQWTGTAASMVGWARTQRLDSVYTLSRSGSVEEVLVTLAQERAAEKPLRVTVSQSIPGAEGAELASVLARAGAHVSLAPDGAFASLMSEVDCALVGADSIRSDGSVVNKLGTFTLALAAQAAAKPIYVLAETLKITARSYPLVIEHGNPTQLLPAPVQGVTAAVPLFDVTPPKLITAIVTERGVLSRTELERLAAEAEDNYLALMRP